MDTKKAVKTAIKIAKIVPFVTATAGVLSLALSKYQEKQGDYSREFSDVENEMKNAENEKKIEFNRDMIFDYPNILKDINPNLNEEIYDMIQVIDFDEDKAELEEAFTSLLV